MIVSTGRSSIFLLVNKTDRMDDAYLNTLDWQVLAVIRLTLIRSVAHKVIKERTTVDLIATLLGLYEKLSTSNKVHLVKKLFNLKMT